MRKFTLIFMIILLAVVPLTGCGRDQRSTDTYAQKLYETRNPYINNNAADGDIAETLKLGSYGKYTLSVSREDHPYTLKINYMYMRSDLDVATFEQEMPKRAAVLMALIKDCEQVDWTYSSEKEKKSGSLSLDSANQTFGIDVKGAWKSEKTFTDMLNQLGLNQ